MLEENFSQSQQLMAGGVTNSIGLVINSSNPLLPSNGGSGVSNNFTVTLGGAINTASSFSTSGANALTLTTSAPTNVTLPASGTLVNTAVTTLSSLASVGTITTGTWQGTTISGTYGGTGVNNGSNTITLGGNINTAGAFTTSGTNPLTLTTTGSTNITLPTSGTLATLGSNGVSVTNVTGTSATMTDSAAINIYVTNNSSQVTLTLPATTTVGHIFRIVGVGSGGWKIAQNSGQSINMENNGSVVTTTAGISGSLSSNISIDCVDIIASVANTTFNMYGAGSISYQ